MQLLHHDMYTRQTQNQEPEDGRQYFKILLTNIISEEQQQFSRSLYMQL